MKLTYNYKGSELANNNGSDQQKFWKKLWAIVKSNLGSILGAAVGGPVGAAVGEIVGRWIAGWSNKQAALGGFSAPNSEISNGTFTDAEVANFSYYLNNIVGPTIVSMCKKIDTRVPGDVFSKTNNVNLVHLPYVIQVANEKFKEIAAVKAYINLALAKGIKGERRQLTIEKMELLQKMVDFLDKAIVMYVEKRNYNQKLVMRTETVSNIKSVDKVKLDWYGTTAKTQVKRYVVSGAGHPVIDQEIILIPTDPTDTTSPFTPEVQEEQNTTEVLPITNKSKTSSYIIVGGVVLCGLYLINKKSE